MAAGDDAVRGERPWVVMPAKAGIQYAVPPVRVAVIPNIVRTGLPAFAGNDGAM